MYMRWTLTISHSGDGSFAGSIAILALTALILSSKERVLDYLAELRKVHRTGICPDSMLVMFLCWVAGGLAVAADGGLSGQLLNRLCAILGQKVAKKKLTQTQTP